VHDGPCLGVVADQDGVQVLLADVLGKLLSEGIVTRFAQRLAPLLESFPERTLAGAVSQDPSSSFSSMLKLSISTDGRREAPWAAMPVVLVFPSAILMLPAP